MQALDAARDVDAPDWLINAGAIRDVVFDALHDRLLTTQPRDVDLGFLDRRPASALRLCPTTSCSSSPRTGLD
jgi:hypothetical protein